MVSTVREGSGVVRRAGQRRSFIEGILTGVMARQNTQVNKVVGRKESGRKERKWKEGKKVVD
jgi:hypothetical protein